MKKTLKVIVDRKTGQIAHDFSGFSGDDCFSEAARIKEKLAARGIVLADLEVVRKEAPPAIPEVSRKRQKVGGR